jgi:hypothetical protein
MLKELLSDNVFLYKGMEENVARIAECHRPGPTLKVGRPGRHLLDHRRGVRLVGQARANLQETRSTQSAIFGE